jgi:hypothetical protein
VALLDFLLQRKTMIPVRNPILEPEEFDKNCRIPGNAWLKAHPKNDPHKARNHEGEIFWKPFLPALRAGFSKRCGYLAIKLPVGGVVDHYVSCNEDRTLSFEWNNYRYSSESVNSRKSLLDRNNGRALDPFDVVDGWFRVVIPSFELVLTDKVPDSIRAIAEDTVQKLGLDSGPEALEARWCVYESHYGNGSINMLGLQRDAPLIASAIAQWIAEGNTPPSPSDRPDSQPAISGRKKRYAPRPNRTKSKKP